jgi:hypothetical protein
MSNLKPRQYKAPSGLFQCEVPLNESMFFSVSMFSGKKMAKRAEPEASGKAAIQKDSLN